MTDHPTSDIRDGIPPGYAVIFGIENEPGPSISRMLISSGLRVISFHRTIEGPRSVGDSPIAVERLEIPAADVFSKGGIAATFLKSADIPLTCAVYIQGTEKREVDPLAAFEEDSRTLLAFVNNIAVPHMQRAPGGSIVVVTQEPGRSKSGLLSRPLKREFEAMVSGCANDLAKRSIRINHVHSKPASSPTTQGGSDYPVPEGDAKSIADSVYFLCSGLARYVTGQTLPVHAIAQRANK